MLRFNNGLTSAGLVLDEAKHPLDESLDATIEWQQWIDRYPSVRAMFAQAKLAAVPGGLIRTPRLQRRWARCAGEDWALLPYAAGFIDPLHSSGIAHSLCGIELLARILDQQWHADTRAAALRDYDAALGQELDLVDELVAGCFATFHQFDLLVMASMLYFAAATTYERLRYEGKSPLAYLCADQTEIGGLLREACTLIGQQASSSSRGSIDHVRGQVASIIAPINHVGLLDPTLTNMYHHTVAPMCFVRKPPFACD